VARIINEFKILPELETLQVGWLAVKTVEDYGMHIEIFSDDSAVFYFGGAFYACRKAELVQLLQQVGALVVKFDKKLYLSSLQDLTRRVIRRHANDDRIKAETMIPHIIREFLL